MCLFLLLALYLCRGDLQDAAPVLALFLCAKVVYLLLYGAVCLVPAQKREKTKKKPRLPAAAEEELFVPPPVSESDPPRPQKVRCFSEGARVCVDKDVRLEEMLRVYRAKTELSAAEADALNDILASLLKMMAKYDL